MTYFIPPVCKTLGPGDRFDVGQFSEDWALEAWERQTYAGVKARYPDLLPHYLFCNINGQDRIHALPIYRP